MHHQLSDKGERKDARVLSMGARSSPQPTNPSMGSIQGLALWLEYRFHHQRVLSCQQTRFAHTLQGWVQSQTSRPLESCSYCVPTHWQKGVVDADHCLSTIYFSLVKHQHFTKNTNAGLVWIEWRFGSLAHLGLMLIGDPLGEATINGKTVDAPTALGKAWLGASGVGRKDGL